MKNLTPADLRLLHRAAVSVHKVLPVTADWREGLLVAIAHAESELLALPEPETLVFRLELGIGTDARAAQAERRAARKRGEKPTTEIAAWAPTLNEYNGLKPWQKEQLRRSVDAAIEAELRHHPSALAGFVETVDPKKGRHRAGGRKRLVRVTRYSSRPVDELSADICGGKVPIDRLVRAGVLTADSPEALYREARYVPCPSGKGQVVVEVFDLAGLPTVKSARVRAFEEAVAKAKAPKRPRRAAPATAEPG